MAGLIEITSLALSRPDSDASAVEVAAWYERKAALLERLADEYPATAEYLTQAAAARHRASELKTTTTDRDGMREAA
jgi:inactivated superfamily I helicase